MRVPLERVAPILLVAAFASVSFADSQYPLTLKFVETKSSTATTTSTQTQTNCTSVAGTEQVNCNSRRIGGGPHTSLTSTVEASDGNTYEVMCVQGAGGRFLAGASQGMAAQSGAPTHSGCQVQPGTYQARWDKGKFKVLMHNAKGNAKEVTFAVLSSHSTIVPPPVNAQTAAPAGTTVSGLASAMDYEAIGRRAKQIYPDYADMDDADLGQRLANKYPDFAQMLLKGNPISSSVIANPASAAPMAQVPAGSGNESAGEIFKKASPAVVTIMNYDDKGAVSATGSGFIVGPDGKILTNYHMIAHTKRATVVLSNHDAYDDVSVLDLDKRKDIAFLKIKAVDLPFLTLGHSNNVEVGQAVFSLSNPLGFLQNTLTQGIISGIRDLDGYKLFQISAPISHGSSGSPVLNSKGEVIGIAVAKIDEGESLNFAVPIDYARGLLASDHPQSLAATYEPEPQPPVDQKNETGAASSPSDASKNNAEVTTNRTPNVPDEMRRNEYAFLISKLGLWTVEDANKVLGAPLREQAAAQPPSITYAYDDPVKWVREIDLIFDNGSRLLRGVITYPWNLTWEQAKQSFGGNPKTVKNANGTITHEYRDKHILVLTDRRNQVISIGSY